MGVHGALLRSSSGRAEVLWIYVGAIIPDIGWILQRLIRQMPVDIDPLRLLSYAAVLSSLAACLIASAAVAALTVRRGRVFCLLATGSLLHLLMDAAEIKWANGVLLLAPFSWTMTTWDLFQQDGAFVLAATAGSLLFVIWAWRAGILEINRAMWRLSPAALSTAAGLVLLFFLWPLPWIDAPTEHGLYDSDVIRDAESRAGRPLELDRARYFSDRNEIRIFTGEFIKIENFSAPADTLVSLRGVFQEPGLLRVDQAIIHHPWQRTATVLAGLGLFALFIMHAACRRFFNPPPNTVKS